MSRPGRNIYKRRDGRWEGRYIKSRVEGKTRYASVYGHSLKEVKERLREASAKETSTNVKKNAGTLESLANEWLEDIKPTLKASSFNKYEDELRCYIKPALGSKEFSTITNDDVVALGKSLLTDGGKERNGLAPSTVIHVMSIMNRLRRFAIHKKCGVNYDAGCFSPKRVAREIRVFTPKEELSLVSWLCSNYNLIAMGILLCLFSGLRVGEICALKWDAFDFMAETFTVSQTMQRIRITGNPEKKTEVRITAPKSACSVRTIPIPDILKPLLLSEYKAGAYILTGDKEKYVEPRTLQNRFKSILRNAKIQDANFHAIRHTFATRCIEQKMDAKCLSEILGHAGVSITLNRYVHPSMSVKQASLAKATAGFSLGEVTNGCLKASVRKKAESGQHSGHNDEKHRIDVDSENTFVEAGVLRNPTEHQLAQI